MITTIFIQSNAENQSSAESRAVIHGNALAYRPLQLKSVGCTKLTRYFPLDGSGLPVGSVSFVQRALALCLKRSDAIDTYPEPLRAFLKRPVSERTFQEVPDDWFVKPRKLKQFTGGIKADLYDHGMAQKIINPNTQVWASPPVSWLSEWRFYIINGEIAGAGRYDDGPDNAPAPDQEVVLDAIKRWPAAPKGYALDFGVLSTGETALVEANDGFSLGYYKGCSPKKYLELLILRWTELFGGDYRRE